MEEHLINGGGGVRKSLQRSSIVVMILNTIKYPNRVVNVVLSKNTITCGVAGDIFKDLLWGI